MIEKLKYLLAGSLLLAAAGGFVACDDDETTIDEWGATYVYLERPQLGSDTKHFALSHSLLGVTGDVEVSQPIVVRLSKPCTGAVEVSLDFAVDKLPEEAVSFRTGGKLVIPAGELSAEETLDVCPDWSFVADEAETYSVEVKIVSVVPVSDALRLSTKQNSLSVRFDKSTKVKVLAGETPEGVRIADRSGWTCAVTSLSGVDHTDWSDISTLLNGNESDYVYYGIAHLGFKFDLGKEYELTGLESVCMSTYAPYYSMTSCTVYVSVDGITWELMTPDDGLSMTMGANQYVKFIAPVTARYVIWYMDNAAYSTVMCSEVYAYEVE